MALIMPKTSWETRGITFPWVGSGRRRVSREPEAVMMCCSLVPENWPRMACVMLEDGWMVREYMNMLDVAAILGFWLLRREAAGKAV